MERYVIRGGLEGYERLRLLARVRWPDTAALLERIGLAPGMRYLDLGCGGGEVTFEIARSVGPDGSVTGIDMDEVKLAAGRTAAAERGLHNVELRAGNVNDWHEVDRYDLVYARFVLQHLSRPVDLLRRMWAAVAPGGVLAVEDADFDGLFCDPPNEGYEFYRHMYPRVLEAHGGDPTIGRKLYRYLLDIGIEGPELRMRQSARTSADLKALALSTLEATAEAIVDEGLATEGEVHAALASLASLADQPTSVLGDPRIFQLWARRV